MTNTIFTPVNEIPCNNIKDIPFYVSGIVDGEGNFHINIEIIKIF